MYLKPALLFLSFLYCLNSLGQLKDNTMLVFGDTRLEIQQKEPGEDQYLIVRDQWGKVERKIKLDKQFDSYSFDGLYAGDRNFALIGGRYLFYLFNLNSHKIIGPLHVQQRMCAQDGQTGVLGPYKIIEDGQYLLVNAMDYGVFCYSLKDIYHPHMLPYLKSDSVFFKGSYTFLDLRKENFYNMISASCGNYKTEIKSEMLFQGYRLQQDSNQSAAFKRVSNKYILFYKIENDSTSELMIDLESGSLVNKKEAGELIKRLINR